MRLQLESSTDVFDLNDILMKGKGVQATRGLAGLGLPAVSTQWLEGAGDGALFRGQRVLPRDIDLPLHLLADNRQELQALVSRLAIMLAGECTLRLVEDDGSSWYTKVRRMGGGGFVYGEDTIGERELDVILTLRAGDPFWTYSEASRKVIENSGGGRGLLNGLAKLQISSSQAIGAITLENRGDATTYPVWEVNGPGKNFRATSATGESFLWTGTLAPDEKLIIDTKAGTVKDGTGANRYSQMASAPRLWSIPPGTTTAQAMLEDTSSGTLGAKGGPIWTNLVTNPRFESVSGTAVTRINLHPNPSLTNDGQYWGFYGGTTGLRSTDRGQYGSSSYKVTASGSTADFGGYGNTLPGAVAAGDPVYGSMYVYSPVERDFRIGVEFKDAANAKLSTAYGSAVRVPANTWTRVGGYGGLAPANTSYVTVTCYSTVAVPAVAGDVAYFDAILIEKAATMESYFDGSWSPSGIYTYRWTGTAYASTSERLAPMATGQATSVDKSYMMHGYAEGSAGSRYGRWRTLPGIPRVDYRVARSTALSRTEIVAGQKYTLLMRMRRSGGWGTGNVSALLCDPRYGNRLMGEVVVTNVGSEWKDVRVTFTAETDGSAASDIGLYCALPNDAPTDTDGYFDLAHWAVIPGEYTGDYFDGDNPDSLTSGIFAWTGASHASTSTNSLAQIVGRSTITCSWQPRKWMVI
ncbi:hypothetical protein [Micromonospora sp. GCM10011541]|uniref:hypothetical protein n=1 Tax=Micromonospora sp. GCM10011541 TaxID=3317336 RepID=UPI0036228748